jgi:GNAT superfamily N-acetyltransferase
MATRTARDFAIRRCTPADAAMLAELGARLFAETYRPTHPEPELSRYLARAFAVDHVRASIASDDATMFVAEDAAAHPIGYAFLRKTSALPDGVTERNSYEVVRFYVDGHVQGRGIGAALMEQCFDESRRRGAKSIWVQAWTQAPWATGFYERMGFVTVGSAPFVFGDRIDADQIMSRTL